MMMKRWMLMIAAVLLVLPAALTAQRGGMQAWQNEAVADLEQMRDKFLSLADAFPEDTWDWMPMEGTRSVRDVMVLMTAHPSGLDHVSAIVHPRACCASVLNIDDSPKSPNG